MIFGFYLGDNLPSILLILAAVAISFIAQVGVQKTYQKYKEMDSSTNLTGREVAEITLKQHGINDVQVVLGSGGELSDFYDPTKKIVSLSNNIYHTNSIAAIAVASHEVGHAIQHATNYQGIVARNKVLPAAIVSNKFSVMILMAGFFFQIKLLIWVGIALYAIGGLFQLVTLPVEFDASKRAVNNIQAMNIVDSEDLGDVRKMLNAAAFTYVAAFLATIAQLVRLILISRSRD